MCNQRLEFLVRFYSILDDLERTIGGARVLADCRGRMVCLAKTSYIHKMNDLAKSSIRTIPVRFSP
jgi:hypothetical protein